MSDADKTGRDMIQDAIAEQIRLDDGDQVIVVNFLTVAEVIDTTEGDPWLKTVGREGITPWTAHGLASALHQVTEHNLRDGWSEEGE